MTPSWTRRRWMQTVIAGSAGLALTRLASAEGATEIAPPEERTLELFNTHTNETVNVVFRRGKEYDTAALAGLRHLLRDHRNDESHDMDVKLYEQLHQLALAAHCEPRFEIISGYRSPESNAKMSTPGSGVAKKSLHMQGRAIDMRLKNCACDDLRDLALAAAQGGVGYYKRSNFVHIDTGAFRTWVG
jgi:uncharacterized protein YcbK (DUF882 family)